MPTHEELDRLLTDLHQKILSLPRPETWQPVACTRWGILDELRTFVHRKTVVVHMLEDLTRREESELTWLEERLGSYENAGWGNDDGYAPESGLAGSSDNQFDIEDVPPSA